MSTETPTRGGNAVVAFPQRRWLSIVLAALAPVFGPPHRDHVQTHPLGRALRR